MKQSDSNIVLDISWLCMINSMIDWVNEIITFLHTETTRLHLILKSSESVKIFAMTANNMHSKLKNSSDAQMLWSRKIKSNLAIIKISKKYQKYKILFEKESDQETLLKHQSWDYEIKLIDDKKLTKQFIYSLSTEKLDALRQYLKKNMWKEFIKELQSSTKYLILFILKLNKSLKLCVNHKALNKIMIKNSYSLLLIFELQDKLQKAQWFTKFDILETFNQIKIKKRWMKDSLLHSTRTLQVFDHVVWFNQCFSHVSDICKQCATTLFESVHHNISEWYTSIFKDEEKTCATC